MGWERDGTVMGMGWDNDRSGKGQEWGGMGWDEGGGMGGWCQRGVWVVLPAPSVLWVRDPTDVGSHDPIAPRPHCSTTPLLHAPIAPRPHYSMPPLLHAPTAPRPHDPVVP